MNDPRVWESLKDVKIIPQKDREYFKINMFKKGWEFFASENVAHVFTWKLTFAQLKKGAIGKGMSWMSIDDLHIDRFIYDNPLNLTKSN